MDPVIRFSQAADRWRSAANAAGAIAKLAQQYPSLDLEKGTPVGSRAAAREKRDLELADADDKKSLGNPPRDASDRPVTRQEVADVAGGIGFTALFLGVGYLGWLILAGRHAR